MVHFWNKGAVRLRLCFGSFAKVLHKFRKNSGVSKEQIGRALLDFIDPTFADGKEASYIYRFMNRRRELPGELKRRGFNLTDLQAKFSWFIEEYLSPNHAGVMDAFVELVTGDDYISEGAQEELLQQKEAHRLALFLAALFAFTVLNTSNMTPPGEMRIRRPALLEQAEATENNVRLAKIAAKAMERPDPEALRRCLERMSNAVYIANTLIALSRHGDSPKYGALFHEYFSGVENNKYRLQIFEECLREGYFRECPAELLEPHFSEITNNRYAYDLLVFLCENGLREEAVRHRDKLTNKTYAKRFAAYLSEN